jgi:hypothetical protein
VRVSRLGGAGLQHRTADPHRPRGKEECWCRTLQRPARAGARVRATALGGSSGVPLLYLRLP